MSKGTVVVAMSGGVDSSVAAALLADEGYDVIGITMRLWTQDGPDSPHSNRACCPVEAIGDARRVCQIIGAPHYIMNLEQVFQERVVDYFVNEYAEGRTPNPCLACNQHMKFDVLLGHARALDADFLATGHYAQVDHTEDTYHLRRAAEPAKDQSYVLYPVTQEVLARLLLPIGRFAKPEVRALAARFGLPVADKRDSQDICFVTDNNYRRFVEERVELTPGPIVDRSGAVLGHHQGIPRYTVGQRHGLGIAAAAPRYVVEIRPDTNTIVVGGPEELQRTWLVAHSFNYISGEAPSGPVPVSTRIRYRSTEASAILTPLGSGRALVEFETPQRAITPGQAVVCYREDIVLGGGIIE